MTEKTPPKDEQAKKPEEKPQTPPREIGGRNGPDPTRYNDWEKGGRCVDF